GLLQVWCWVVVTVRRSFLGAGPAVEQHATAFGTRRFLVQGSLDTVEAAHVRFQSLQFGHRQAVAIGRVLGNARDVERDDARQLRRRTKVDPWQRGETLEFLSRRRRPRALA